MLANKTLPKFESYKLSVDYLKLAGLLATLISLPAILQVVQLTQNLHNDHLLELEPLVFAGNNGANQTESDQRVGLVPNIGHNQEIKSPHRARRSLPFQEDEEIYATGLGHHQLDALVIPVGSELRESRSDLSNDAAEHQALLANLYHVPEQQHPPHPNYFRPTYYSMPIGESNEVHQQQQPMASLVDNNEPIKVIPPAIRVNEPVQGDISRKVYHQQEVAIDLSNQVPESFDHLVKDDILPVKMVAHDSYEPTSVNSQLNLKPKMVQSSNYHPMSEVAEIRLGHDHVLPIHSNDLSPAAGHYYGKRKHHTLVKKKIYYIKAKKKKVIVVKKVKKKKKKKRHYHHGGGHHHGKYYMFTKVPKKKSWESGLKRGNKKHWVERHEKGHKNKFNTQVKWYDAKSKGKGHHVWDYNHHDKKKKKHYG